MQLFRPEVLRHRQHSHLGAIRVGGPPRFAIVAATAVCLGAALVAFACRAHLVRKATLNGLLWPVHGALSIIAPQAGVLAEARVAEGEAVETGQVLFVLNLDRDAGGGETGALVAHAMATRRATLETELRAAQRQTRQRGDLLADRLRSLEAELRRVEADAAAARRRVELASHTLDRFVQLAREGFVSPLQAQDKEAQWLDATARERDTQRVAAALIRDIAATRAEQAAVITEAQADQARLERSLAALDQEAREHDARRRIVFTAQQAGIVAALTAHPGQAILPGQSLATLIPREAAQSSQLLEAHLYAESRTAGFLRSGQPVWLRYDAYPHHKFGMAEGHVTAISHTPIPPQDLPPGLHAREPLYRLTVRLSRQFIDAYGKPEPLKAGMTLKADVHQDRRAIWEWLLEPILAGSNAL